MKFSLDLQWPNLPTEDQIHRFFINEKKMYLKIFRFTLRFIRKSYRNVEFSRIFDLRKSYRRGSPRIHVFMVAFTCGWYHEIIIQQISSSKINSSAFKLSSLRVFNMTRNRIGNTIHAGRFQIPLSHSSYFAPWNSPCLWSEKSLLVTKYCLSEIFMPLWLYDSTRG